VGSNPTVPTGSCISAGQRLVADLLGAAQSRNWHASPWLIGVCSARPHPNFATAAASPAAIQLASADLELARGALAPRSVSGRDRRGMHIEAARYLVGMPMAAGGCGSPIRRRGDDPVSLPARSEPCGSPAWRPARLAHRPAPGIRPAPRAQQRASPAVRSVLQQAADNACPGGGVTIPGGVIRQALELRFPLDNFVGRLRPQGQAGSRQVTSNLSTRTVPVHRSSTNTVCALMRSPARLVKMSVLVNLKTCPLSRRHPSRGRQTPSERS
jgi:hypothetical protein